MASTVTVQRRFDPNDTSKPKLWAAKICPYAEKTVIALHEMGISYDKVEVDLMNKPASLFEVNPKGLVPAMLDQGNCITDSYNILQYIDEMWVRSDNKSFFPTKPADRATARTWCDFINSKLAVQFYNVLLREGNDKDAAKAPLLESLKVLNDAIKSISSGPFFMGAEFGIVDVMLAPHVLRFAAIKKHAGFDVPETEEYERFNSWWKAVKEVPCFKDTRPPEDYIVEMYGKYAEFRKSKQTK